MANTIIRCYLPTVLLQYKERFKGRVLDSTNKMILVKDLTHSEKTELSKDPQVKIFKQVFYPPPKRRLK